MNKTTNYLVKRIESLEDEILKLKNDLETYKTGHGYWIKRACDLIYEKHGAEFLENELVSVASNGILT